jgi:hypothetical protein
MNADALAGVVKHLRVMGYDPTAYRTSFALLSLQSGYNEAEVAWARL